MEQKIEDIYKIISDNCLGNNSIGLASGNSGLILFLFYYYKLTQNPKAFDQANELLEKTFDIVSKDKIYPSLCDGIAGFGWLVEHLNQNEFIECDTDAVLVGVDEYVYQSLLTDFSNSNGYDLLHGAIGKGLYLLKRNDVDILRLEKMTNLILKLSESPYNDKLRWTSLHHQTGQPISNLSLSHGIASIINFYSRLYKKEIAKENSKKILDDSISYLMQFECTNNLSVFPNYITLDNVRPNASRLAWCYGDLGIGISLWQASQTLKSKELEDKSIEIFLHSEKRHDLKKNFVVDAGLCHGTAGIAHIFNRMYRNTGVQQFNDAAGFWFGETLKMAKYNDGFAGYKVWRTPEYGGLQNDYGFLEGIAGVGLALISAVSDIEPKWDECLLIS